MKKDLIHDPIFLAVKSDAATPDDLPTARDLIDTLTEHSDDCVGMAANMIGVRRRIIVFYDESEKTPTYTVMMNPVIIEKHGEYTAKEGCLSLLGAPRECRRYRTIKVRYQTPEFHMRTKKYTGYTAQIIQHEIDHCDGVLI